MTRDGYKSVIIGVNLNTIVLWVFSVFVSF